MSSYIDLNPIRRGALSIRKGIASHPLVGKFHDTAGAGVRWGWGYRPSGLRAKSSGGAYMLYEDAPVRSLRSGYGGAVYGITADSQGAMFDASGESDLIEALQGKIEVGADTAEIMQQYRSLGISKYNWSLPSDTSSYEEGVLLVDQSRGDASLLYGGVGVSGFSKLFADALAENPEAVIYIKTHPDHKFRKKRSCFSEEELSHPRVKILPAELSPADCFMFCKKVYVGTSLLGIEALIHGCEVITYGWNFYAGWGLTTDRGGLPRAPRAREHALIELFQACYIDYSHYYDPDTLEPCGLSRIIEHIALQKRYWERFRGSWTMADLNMLQRSILPSFMHGPETTLTTGQAVDYMLTWGAKDVSKALESLPLTRMEDGFIRSNGLGAEFNFPMSWVFDDVGIYFDARSPSKLENDLNEYSFSLEELTEAEELMTFLRENKLTKYNLGIESVTLPESARGRKVILIPGQVDSDASIKYGSPKLSNNRELLAEVRRQNPDAFICYKPHPDLLAGARRDSPLWEGIEGDVDHLVLEGDIISWIQAVDEVHTLTSTVGFEALLHHKPVYTYGLPFYAGWGLTHDWLTCERRRSKRSLSELTCAVLILYPTYVNPKTKEFTSAMNAARILTDPNFRHDSRSGLLRVVGKAKSYYYKLVRRL